MEQGILDFNQGRFWEAHESWEEGWVKLPEPHRTWMKAMIQICGVFVHIQKKHRDPALRLAMRATELMTEANAQRKLLGQSSNHSWSLEIDRAEETLSAVIDFLRVSTDQNLDWSHLEALGQNIKARLGQKKGK